MTEASVARDRQYFHRRDAEDAEKKFTAKAQSAQRKMNSKASLPNTGAKSHAELKFRVFKLGSAQPDKSALVF